MTSVAFTSTVLRTKRALTLRRAHPAPTKTVARVWKRQPAVIEWPADTRTRAVDLDRLSAHWRIAFDTAEDALRAADRCGRSLRLAKSEVHERAGRLAQERKDTAWLLDTIAREEHVRLDHALSTPRVTRRMLGLPQAVRGCVFDLEGVLAGSSRIHAAAWAEALDEFLSRRVESTGERFAPYTPFDPGVEYERYIQGKPRLEGVHAFLASRGIRLPEGSAADPTGAETVWGLATRKHEALLQRLDREGVSAFAGARVYLEGAREAGLACAVVSASADARDDPPAGRARRPDRRAGRRCGDRDPSGCAEARAGILLAACALLGVRPRDAATFETTPAGVDAGRSAGFGLVIAIDRRGQPTPSARTAPISSSPTSPPCSTGGSGVSALRLLPLRHGESTWNDEGLFTDWSRLRSPRSMVLVQRGGAEPETDRPRSRRRSMSSRPMWGVAALGAIAALLAPGRVHGRRFVR